MKLVLSQSAYVLLASSSLTIATWRLLQWRARKRAKIAAERMEGMVKPGSLLNTDDKAVCENIVNAAIRRASKWISFQLKADDGMVMIGQVGGVSVHKRPLLTLEPDYVMKPVQTDHRGMREIFFYEAVKVLSKNRNGNTQPYANLLTGVSKSQHQQQLQQQNNNSQLFQAGGPGFTDLCDTLAMWLAMKMNDPVVADCEKQINQSWKVLKKEMDTLRRLATFIPSYYGVVGQRSPLTLPKGEEEAHNKVALEKEQLQQQDSDDVFNADRFGMTLHAHLLLTKVTANFRKPCVIDIKMGSQAYEPDAPEDKRVREIAKYPEQETYGFRIVGMRIFDPAHADADENGYRFFPKEYGRSLNTTEDIMDALRLYLSAGCAKEDTSSETDSFEKVDASDSNVDSAAAGSTSTEPKPSPTGSGSSSGGEGTVFQDRVRIRVLSNLLAQLRPIFGFFDENKTLCFYSSSLLLVYEGDRNAPNPDVTSVKMIDFGRVRREPGGDHGYRLGLRTLKTMLDKIRKEEKQRMES